MWGLLANNSLIYLRGKKRFQRLYLNIAKDTTNPRAECSWQRSNLNEIQTSYNKFWQQIYCILHIKRYCLAGKYFYRGIGWMVHLFWCVEKDIRFWKHFTIDVHLNFAPQVDIVWGIFFPVTHVDLCPEVDDCGLRGFHRSKIIRIIGLNTSCLTWRSRHWWRQMMETWKTNLGRRVIPARGGSSDWDPMSSSDPNYAPDGEPPIIQCVKPQPAASSDHRNNEAQKRDV